MADQLDFRPSRTSGADPASSPYLDRSFWNSYKSMSRGQLGGITLGALVGVGLGVATGGLAYIGLPLFGMSAGIAGLGMAGTAAVAGAGVAAATTKYYHNIFKTVGAVSGAVSAGMEINEERSQVLNIKLDTLLNLQAKQGNILPEEIREIEDRIEAVYRRGTEKFENKFNGRTVFWKTALVGALAATALVGAMLGGGFALGAALGHPVAMTAEIWAGSLLALGGAALGGATYGINRQVYRNVINVTNSVFDSNPMEASILKAKQMGRAPETEMAEYVDVSKGPSASMGHRPVQTPSLPMGPHTQQYIAQMHAMQDPMPAAKRSVGGSWEQFQQDRMHTAQENMQAEPGRS